MTRDEFQAAQTQVFDELDKQRPTVRAPLSAKALTSVSKVAWRLQYFAPPIGGALAMYLAIENPNPVTGLLIGAISGALFSAVLAMRNDGPGMDKKTPSHLYLARQWFALWGKDATLSEEQAKKLAKWSRAHPRIADTCIRWASENSATTLTQQHFKLASSAKKKLDLNAKEFDLSEAERIELEKVHAALNADGMLDRALTIQQSNTLQKETPRLSTQGPKSRL